MHAFVGYCHLKGATTANFRRPAGRVRTEFRTILGSFSRRGVPPRPPGAVPAAPDGPQAPEVGF